MGYIDGGEDARIGWLWKHEQRVVSGENKLSTLLVVLVDLKVLDHRLIMHGMSFRGFSRKHTPKEG